MMKRSSLALASAVAASLLVACMSPVIGERTATIVIATAPAPGSRALTGGWPMGGLPVFSDITVSVLDSEGNEMLLPKEPVVSGNSISVTVTAGNDLTLVVDAAPDWDATSVRYPDMPLPILVNGYTGRKLVDIPANASVSVSISLVPSATRIPLPNPNGNWQLGVADGLYSQSVEQYTLSGLSSATHFAFDASGLFYASLGSSVGIFGSGLTTPLQTIPFQLTPYGIALCPVSNRIYGYYQGDGCQVAFVDLDDTGQTTIYANTSGDYSLMEGGIAVDATGNLYAMAYESASDTNGLLRFSVGEPSGSTAIVTPIAFVRSQDLGLGYYYDGGDAGMIFNSLIVEDMVLHDGALYLALSELTPAAAYDFTTSQLAGAAISRGKIVAIDPNTLQYLWEVGWRGDLERRPESPNAAGMFAPRRFLAIAPKRLYVLDEGFYVDVSKYLVGTWYPFEDVDRLIAIDLETRALLIGETGLTDGYVNYDSDPYSTYANC